MARSKAGSRLVELARRNSRMNLELAREILRRVRALRQQSVPQAEYDLLPPFTHQPRSGMTAKERRRKVS